MHVRTKTFHGPQQAKVAFGDQVGQVETAAGEAAGNVDHQAEIRADQSLASGNVTGLHPDGQFALLGSRQKRNLRDIADVIVHRHPGAGTPGRVARGTNTTVNCGVHHDNILRGTTVIRSRALLWAGERRSCELTIVGYVCTKGFG